MPVKTAQMCLVNSFFKLFLTDYMASFPSGLARQCACRIYPNLVKENFLHDLAAFVTSKLAIETSKATFCKHGRGGSVCCKLCCSYIHNLPFKKCNLIGLCFLGYTYEVHFAPLGLKLDIP